MPPSPAWLKRRSIRIMLLLLCAIVLAGVVWFRPTGFVPRPASISPVLRSGPVAVAPGIYLLGRSSPAAVYLVETSEGLVLVDSGVEADAGTVLAQLAELGFDIEQLRAVLLTHVHADHSLGAAHLRALTGAKVYAGRGDAAALRQGGPRPIFFSTYHMPKLTAHTTTVDVALDGNEVIPFGGMRFTPLASPGHTAGSICYLLERPGLRALFTGDVVQNLSRPSGGYLGTQAARLPPRYGADARDYLATLRRLRALPRPDLVLPGHPQMDATPQNPRLTDERWHDLLDTGIAELETLLARYQADGADFLDGNPRELLPGLHYFGDVGESAVYALDTTDNLFLFNAPGGRSLVDLVSDRFAKLGWQKRKLTAVFLTSADPEAAAGLRDLVERTGCRVVAPKAGVQAVQRLVGPGINLLTEDDLPAQRWFDGESIPLVGRGVAPIAYHLRWAKKSVLISGRIPVKMSGAAAEELRREFAADGKNADYLRALDALARLQPDLWLPGVPVHGQNANLYDFDWPRLLNENRQLYSW